MSIDKIKKEFEECFYYMKPTEEQKRNFVYGDLKPTDFDDIWQFIEQALKEVRDDTIDKMLVKEKSPYKPQLCQNRNHLDYCCTCEQAWEDCSCLARNTGFNQCCALQREKAKKL